MELGLTSWHWRWQSGLCNARRNYNTQYEFYSSKCPGTKPSEAAYVGFCGAEWRRQQELEQVQEPEEAEIWPQGWF